MDNITHGLIGFALAKFVAERRQGPPPRARALVWASVLASNLPDADFLVRLFSDDKKLTYLLQHRGYTHTLLWVFPLSCLAAWFGALVARYRPNRREGAELILLAYAAGLLHILFDGLNNYGVHPFYPFDNAWHYGDVLFIVEPWLFGPLLALLAFSERSRWSRLLAGIIGVALLALMVRVKELGIANVVPALVFIAASAGLQAYVARRAPAQASLVALGVVGVVVATFLFAGHRADAEIRARLAKVQPPLDLVEIVKTPTPGNPFCWNVLVTERDAREFRAHRGVVSLAPRWFSPEQCRFRSERVATAQPRVAPALVPAEPEAGVILDTVYAMSLDHLRSRYAAECRVRAFFQFARVPFFASPTPDRPTSVIGDLRYDNAQGIEFAEVEFGAAPFDRCLASVPPWEPPRLQLLGSVATGSGSHAGK